MHLFPLATTAECVTMPRYRTPSTSKLRAEQSRCCRPPAPHHCSWPRDAAGLQTPTMPSEPSSLPRNHLPRRDTLPAGSISPPGDPNSGTKENLPGPARPPGPQAALRCRRQPCPAPARGPAPRGEGGVPKLYPCCRV